MKSACVDTHALVWYLSSPRRLGRKAVQWMKDVDRSRCHVLIPAIVGIELGLLRRTGRKTIHVPQLEALLTSQAGFSMLPMDFAQVKEFAFLETLQDPFDRMVVSAARVAQVPLITADSAIRDSALVDVVWD